MNLVKNQFSNHINTKNGIMNLKILILLFVTGTFNHIRAKDYELSSPDGNITIEIKNTDRLYYKVKAHGQQIIWYSPISMTLENDIVLGNHPIIISNNKKSVQQEIKPVWGIRNKIIDHYNQLTLKMEGSYGLIFRAYNEGIAYRFTTAFSNDIKIIEEEVSYRFPENQKLVAHVVGDFQTSYEKLYTRHTISDVVEEEFVSLPLLVDHGKIKTVITEADLYDYPGMYIKRKGNNNRFDLNGLFPEYPTKWEAGGWCQFNLRVQERAPYLAATNGTRNFPWRLMIIAQDDIELADNDLVYKLARPATIDTDWIKPGKVAWDWWNDWNLTGVDFETGINNQTYEYYIDFAAKHGLEYIIMDEGWSDQFDLFLTKANLDVPYLADYAKKKGVKIILWCVWHTLDRQMEEALDLFKKWRIAGTKVDFIDRDDQIAINFYEKLAVESAKRELLVDYHGCSKPTGLHRTYPNVINYEAVRGNEYNKFATGESPAHNVDIVFTRMITGPMDYTPGAMRNSTQGNFQMNNSNTMSEGTRCHQLGMFVVYFSPLQMLCDAPTAYEAAPDILAFLSGVPVTWDDTKVLSGKLGEYVAIARRKGKDWYIGALTNWMERQLEIDLSFLGNGTFEATMFLDGINANKNAEDYRVLNKKLTGQDAISIMLRKGGGAAIHLKKTQ